MTNLCQFKRGFFTLRRCDRPAMKQCGSCGKPTCQYHLSAQSEMRICVDCAEQQNQQQSVGYYEDNWVYSYRSRYYQSGYQPYLYGHHDYSSFNTYDDGVEEYDDDSAGALQISTVCETGIRKVGSWGPGLTLAGSIRSTYSNPARFDALHENAPANTVDMPRNFVCSFWPAFAPLSQIVCSLVSVRLRALFHFGV